jgi:hypothetical protein
VVGEFDRVDKEQVQATAPDARDAVAAEAKELQAKTRIDKELRLQRWGGEAVTLENLDAWEEGGESCAVVVAASPKLETTRGVGLLSAKATARSTSCGWHPS